MTGNPFLQAATYGSRRHIPIVGSGKSFSAGRNLRISSLHAFSIGLRCGLFLGPGWGGHFLQLRVGLGQQVVRFAGEPGEQEQPEQLVGLQFLRNDRCQNGWSDDYDDHDCVACVDR